MTQAREVTELITPGPADALAGLLGVPWDGVQLPLLWHWAYLLDRPPQAVLGPDGRRQAPLPVSCDYSYRLVAPLFDDQGLIVSAAPSPEEVQVMVRDAAGRSTATGVIRPSR